MIIIIDAYNFIKQISGTTYVSESALGQWLDIFKRYVMLRKNRVILVFDAGPYVQETQQFFGEIEIFYSGHNKTADDVIKKWIQKHKNQDVLLVTSDREIRDFAEKYAIISVSSHDFYKVFSRVIHQEKVYERKVAQTLYKMTDFESRELDSLMETSSRYLVKQSVHSENLQPVRIRNGKKVAKQDKQILKKLEKI